MLRYHLVEAFIDAMHKACTRRNIQAGFRKSGVIPVNPLEPINNHLTALNELQDHDEIIPRGTVNSMILNDEDGLEMLAQMQFKRSFDEDVDLNIPAIIQRMKAKSKEEGIPITELPLIFLREEESTSITEFSLED
jgi:hypothetical protein